MPHAANPYALPENLAPDLTRVLAYWRGLLRGNAEIPFWDDLNLEALPDLAPRLMLIEAFALPERFRLNIVGEEIEAMQPRPVTGLFADELILRHPLELLRAQCSATVESGAPTFLAWTGEAVRGAEAVGRLLLPMWGDGRISRILGVVEWR